MATKFNNPLPNETYQSVWKESFEDMCKLFRKGGGAKKSTLSELAEKAKEREKERIKEKLKTQSFEALLQAKVKERQRQADFLLRTLSYGAVKKARFYL